MLVSDVLLLKMKTKIFKSDHLNQYVCTEIELLF